MATCIEKAKEVLDVSRVKECRDLRSRKELERFSAEKVVVIKPQDTDDIVVLYPQGGRKNQGTKKWRSAVVQAIMIREGDGMIIYNLFSNGLRVSVRWITHFLTGKTL